MDTVTVLLERNADPNKKSLIKGSSLFIAVERDSTQIVRSLLSYGANPYDRNQSNQSIISVASEHNNENIIKMIKNALKGIRPKSSQVSDHLKSSSNPEPTTLQEVRKPTFKDRNINRSKMNEDQKNALKVTNASFTRWQSIFNKHFLLREIKLA